MGKLVVFDVGAALCSLALGGLGRLSRMLPGRRLRELLLCVSVCGEGGGDEQNEKNNGMSLRIEKS